MNYFAITKADMLNGEGLRVVLWVAGCSHHCKNCHNSYTWDKDGGLPFTEEAKQELFNELENNYIQGVTLSGGDPLFIANRKVITELLEEIAWKYPEKDIWLYTGYEYEEVKHLPLMDYVHVLLDGKFIPELADVNYPWMGSTNQKLRRLK
jgi:anaerobic ribonucleoside-triphosphate reductase activating protein